MARNANKEAGFKKFDEYRSLISAARPDFYRANAFRVLGLCKICFGADEKLFFSGGAGKNVMLPIVDPQPTDQEIARANERLSNPDLRFIDEFFWFILGRDKRLASPETIRLLASSDHLNAAVSWCDEEYRSRNPVARHNIAVFCHALALDRELCNLKTPMSPEELASAASLWSLAFKYWKMLLDDDEFWNDPSSALYAIAEKHLTTDIFKHLRHALPYFLLTINARLALLSSRSGTAENVRRQLDIMRSSDFGAEIVDEVLSDEAAPEFAELEGAEGEIGGSGPDEVADDTAAVAGPAEAQPEEAPASPRKKYPFYAKIAAVMSALVLLAVFIDVETLSYMGRCERTIFYYKMGILNRGRLMDSMKAAIFRSDRAAGGLEKNLRMLVDADPETAGKFIFDLCADDNSGRNNGENYSLMCDPTDRGVAVRIAYERKKPTGYMVCAGLICMTDSSPMTRRYGEQVAAPLNLRGLAAGEVSDVKKLLIKKLCGARGDACERAARVLGILDPGWQRSPEADEAVRDLIVGVMNSRSDFNETMRALNAIDFGWRARAEAKTAVSSLAAGLISNIRYHENIIRMLEAIDSGWHKQSGMLDFITGGYLNNSRSDEIRRNLEPILIRYGDQAIPGIMMGMVLRDRITRENCRRVLEKINPKWNETGLAEKCVTEIVSAPARPGEDEIADLELLSAVRPGNVAGARNRVFEIFLKHSDEPEYSLAIVRALNNIDPAWKETNEGKRLIYKMLRLNKSVAWAATFYRNTLAQIDPGWESKEFLDKSISGVMPSMFEYKDPAARPLERLENDFPEWRKLPLSRRAFVEEFARRDNLLKVNAQVLERYLKILGSFETDASGATAKVFDVFVKHGCYDTRAAASGTLDAISPGWKKNSPAVHELRSQLGSASPAARRDAAKLLILVDPSCGSDAAVRAALSE